MSDNRQMAAQLLNDAAQTVVNNRPGVHGSAENSFEMIAELWTVYLRHAKRVRATDDVLVSAVDVAQMMTLLKKARFMYGNPDNADNFIDDLGYTSLAGMIQLPDPDEGFKQAPARVTRPKRAPEVSRAVIDGADLERALAENRTVVTPPEDEEEEPSSASALLKKIYKLGDEEKDSV